MTDSVPNLAKQRLTGRLILMTMSAIEPRAGLGVIRVLVPALTNPPLEIARHQ